MSDGQRFVEKIQSLLFQVDEQNRWLQDSPVLPDVWAAYAAAPDQRVDLLITPHRGTRPAHLAQELRAAISVKSGKIPELNDKDDSAIAFNQSLVVARLTFDELIRFVVPASRWFQRNIGKYLAEIQKIQKLKASAGHSKDVADALERKSIRSEKLTPTALWWLRLTGTMSIGPVEASAKSKSRASSLGKEILDRACQLLPDDSGKSKANANKATSSDLLESPPSVFRISLNRPTTLASQQSIQAIKVDAGLRVFEVDTSRICWAVLDSGIDARHSVFYDDKQNSRVIESYDFTKIRRLIDLASTLGTAAETAIKKEFNLSKEMAQKIRTSLAIGADIDWELLRPALRVKPTDDAYFDSLNPHGTHVAGILGGRSPAKPMEDVDDQFCGVCPDIRLIDIRILNAKGQSKDAAHLGEFDTIAALQFVRHLNSFGSEMAVHGVNLSIQLQHDPTNFACGRTPVCEECNRLVASGVVVVAAAGNMGIEENSLAANTTEGSFRDISITDPGNAESVITVGSTHRSKPFAYGVSYFSSRGPTGDGRMKPDLVAPGEKVIGPVGFEGFEEMQGTSQAAPFVSGAAAILMARNNELVGDPAKVKTVLCQSATDLGRRREFQGAGLVDVLRALQML